MSNPQILIINSETKNEELRAMSEEEYQEYISLQEESSRIIQKEQEAIVKKEIAIAKLVALGLSEDEVKAVIG